MKRRDMLAGMAPFALLGLPSIGQSQVSALKVRSNFPGGSAKILGIDQAARRIQIAPDSSADDGWPVWWYMRIDGALPGETLTVEVNVTGFGRPDRAAISLDNRTWTQTPPGEQRSRTLVVYTFQAPNAGFWLACGPPLGAQVADEMLHGIARANAGVQVFELAKTREGRPVEGLHIRPVRGKPRRAIWIHARQHAWEAGSSWVGFGFVDWFLSAAPEAVALRRTTELYFVPVMDIDAVEKGFGGKNQKPHDPNFDWGDDNYFPQIAAAMQRLRRLEAQKRLAVFLDLHNPEPAAKGVFFYVPAQPLLTPQRLVYQDRFLQLARQHIDGPMAFDGHLGPIGAGYDPKVDKTSESWVASFARPQVASVSVETPWNTPYSTQQGYGHVGAQLGRTVNAYLTQLG